MCEHKHSISGDGSTSVLIVYSATTHCTHTHTHRRTFTTSLTPEHTHSRSLSNTYAHTHTQALILFVFPFNKLKRRVCACVLQQMSWSPRATLLITITKRRPCRGQTLTRGGWGRGSVRGQRLPPGLICVSASLIDF